MYFGRMDEKEGGGGVNIGGMTFRGKKDLMMWLKQKLPPHSPFDCSMDTYSFLDMVLQNGNGNGLKDIESRHKLSLSGDDSTNLESFTREMPKVFGGSVTIKMATIKGSMRSTLPDLPTFKSWEDSKSKKDLRDIVKRKMVNIEAQMRANTQSRLASHETTMLVAVAFLDGTVSFVTTLLTFISDTHQDLTDADFPEEASW